MIDIKNAVAYEDEDEEDEDEETQLIRR